MFGLFETSRTRGQPLELYQFDLGSKTFAYCNGDKPFTFAGLVYEPVPITRSAIVSSGTLDRQTLTVNISGDAPLAVLLRSTAVHSAVLSLTLRQGHKDDPDKQFLVAWVGRVLGVQGNPDDGSREFTCQPASTSLKRVGLRRNWQFGCPHVLYGDQCRASQPAASVSALVTGGSGRRVEMYGGWNRDKPIAKFVGGIASWRDEVRTILRADASSVTLAAAADLVVGEGVVLSLGCDHLRDDCTNLHRPRDEAPYGAGNIRNYGGQPFIPQTNPIGFVSNYS